MNCSEARTLLNLMGDGALDTRDTALVVDHTKECNECADEWSEMEHLRDRFRQLREAVALPQGEIAKIKELISSDSSGRGSAWRDRLGPAPLMLVAAAVAIVGLVCLSPKLNRSGGSLVQPVTAAALVDDLTDPSSLKAVADKEALPPLLGYDLKYIHLPGWNMQRAGVYKGSPPAKIARFDFSRATSSGVERMSCYQAYAGSILLREAADTKVIAGRRVAFGRHNEYNFALWSQNGRDYLLVSLLPREAIEAVVQKA
jgi:hypothetical protein